MPVETTIVKGNIHRPANLQRIIETFSNAFGTIIDIGTVSKAEIQATGLTPGKMICEVCLFFHLAYDVVKQDQVLLRKVKCFIKKSDEYILNPEIVDHVGRFPAGVHRVGMILLCAITYGVASEKVKLLAQAIRSPAYFSTERMPFRFQESVWLYEQITGEKLADHHWCVSALMSRNSHPCVLKRDDLYAKTHSIMYETNFGSDRVNHTFGNDKTMLSLSHDLNASFCNADWDLVGEICLANQFIGNFDPPSRQCLNALHAVFQRFDFIPSITFDAQWAGKLSTRELCLYKFAHSYHSTLVYGLLLLFVTDDLKYIEVDHDVGPDEIEMLSAIEKYLGCVEFDLGPLNPNWYAANLDVLFETIIDGYASKCYIKSGKRKAVEFINSIPRSIDLRLVRDTLMYVERI